MAAVIGGAYNGAKGSYATTTGGYFNSAVGSYATVVGGAYVCCSSCCRTARAAACCWLLVRCGVRFRWWPHERSVVQATATTFLQPPQR